VALVRSQHRSGRVAVSVAVALDLVSGGLLLLS
jgi:hypothetical protein